MIFVREQPEPMNFSATVRTPGETFLNINQNPTNKDFKNHRYWSACLGDLFTAYNGICAYSAQWIPPQITRGSVDHYIPKSDNKELAYEWSNYRLCTERMNNNKDSYLDVMDPFKIQNGWFTINFATFFVEPEARLPDYLKAAVDTTITRLRLNDDDTLVQGRANKVQEYADGDVSFAHLERRYPFIAYELDRQGLKDTINVLLRKTPST